jgi:hypothetical protein
MSCRGPGIALGYRANLWLRAAVRVLQLVSQDSLDPDRPGGEVPVCRSMHLQAAAAQLRMAEVQCVHGAASVTRSTGFTWC